jgi:hypothetical protein
MKTEMEISMMQLHVLMIACKEVININLRWSPLLESIKIRVMMNSAHNSAIKY